MRLRQRSWLGLWLVCLLSCAVCGLSSLPAASAAAAEETLPFDVEKAMTQSYYDLFGLEHSATAREVKKASDVPQPASSTAAPPSRLLSHRRPATISAVLPRRYRTVALRYHPDKFGDDSNRAAVHELFIRINLANEVLSDERLRARYDELLADGTTEYSDHAYRMFERARDERQYGAYRAYAMRAARGDVEWGEVLVMGVSVLCAVGPLCRWLWVERKRKIKAKEKAKEGVKKSKKDVETRMKEAQKMEEEKERRRAAPQRDEDSDDEEEAVDGESEERRREKELRRTRLKKTRAAIRALLKPLTRAEEEEAKDGDAAQPTDDLNADDVDLVVRDTVAEEVEQLLASFEAIIASQEGNDAQRRRRLLAAFKAALAPLATVRQQQAEQAAQQQQRLAAQAASAPSNASSGKPQASTQWPPYEVSALARAMAKHPGGSVNRWERITALVNAANDAANASRTRSVKEVLARVKVDEARAVLGAGDDRAYEAYLERMKRPATGGSVVEGGEAQAKEAEVVGGVKEAPKEALKAKERTDEWSGTEQGALEAALRSVPREVEDRWDRIAAVVVSKTKRQCIARYKLIREQIAASKGSPGA